MNSAQQVSDTTPMTTKVRVDLSAGTLEAEGSEEFIRELYKDFTERLEAKIPYRGTDALPTDSQQHSVPDAAKKAGERKKGTGKGGTVRERTPVFVKDLDLATKGTRSGLKDFLKAYRKLKSSQEHNLGYVYYLARILDVHPITMDHVYTCYKETGERPPGVLPQSLWDTARLKGTIDAVSMDDIKLTLRGENWVEHDLEKAKENAD